MPPDDLEKRHGQTLSKNVREDGRGGAVRLRRDGGRGVPAVLAAGANDRVVIGAMGMSRGLGVAQELAKLNVRIAYVCDPDQARLDRAEKATGAEHAVADVRRVLDDKAVDAVVIATPDHWHAPAAILACAGRQARLRREALLAQHPRGPADDRGRPAAQPRGAGRHAEPQHADGLATAIQLLREGAIGNVLVAKAWNSQRRANIGHATAQRSAGGVRLRPLGRARADASLTRRTASHYTWHWWYDFGTGDMGNDGVHDIDIARWGLGRRDASRRGSPATARRCSSTTISSSPTRSTSSSSIPATDARRPKQLLIYEQRIWSPYVQEGTKTATPSTAPRAT